MHTRDVTIIGGGITGSIAACLLHDRGLSVRILDRHGVTMQGASRWNEGKLHLGYTYTGTDSLDTARLLLDGTGHFERVLRAICGRSIDESWWSQPVVYLVDPDSIFPADLLWARAQRVAALLSEYARTRDGLHRFTEPLLDRLTTGEARALTGQQRIAAAWRTGERSVSPKPVAAMISEAVARRGIEVIGAEVESLTRADGEWRATCRDGAAFSSRGIINASWESQALLDRPLEMRPRPVCIRYKVALFGSSLNGWRRVCPSTRILGAYGDITPYGDGDIYLSWYPAGMLARSDDGIAPSVPQDFDRAAMTAATLAGLGLENSHDTACTVHGGYIVAVGNGEITERESSLHERNQAGAKLLAPDYVTVDTGKYSLGPFLATQATELLIANWKSQ